MEAKEYYYFDKNIDKTPCPVKIFQTGDKGKRVEISRDLDGKAGFWVDTNQLMVKDKEVVGEDSIDVYYKFIESLTNNKQ